MSPLPRLSSLLAPVLPWLAAIAVPLAAVLAFALQPLLAKSLLPAYGASAGLWPACVVYFQLALLLGYLWAGWLRRRTPAVQTLATAGLGLVALATFGLPTASASADVNTLGIVLRLALTTLPTLVLLFSASPLLHDWMQRRGQEVPYYVYAVANLGALAALWLYPFAIETALRLSEQALLGQGLLALVAALLALTSFLAGSPNASPPPHTSTPIEDAPRTSPIARLTLAALTCLAMLAATGHLSAELGSAPLAWVGPLGLYLFSFMVVFSGRWQRWMTIASLGWLTASVIGFMAAKGFAAVPVNGVRAWFMLSLTASLCFLGHALLYETRPRARLDRFYVELAAGGLIGALVFAVLVPRLLSVRAELPLAGAVILAAGIYRLIGRPPLWLRATIAAALLLPILGVGLVQMRHEALDGTIDHRRDLDGTLMIKTDAHSVVLSREGTTQATQITGTADALRRPTLYYGESSAVGRAITKLRETHPQLRVGIIGLHGGTLATYAQPGDVFTFWDRSPSMHRIAHENFSYVGAAAGRVVLSTTDARDELARSRDDYDLIVIDAYAAGGDSLPAYLLTQEAHKIYRARLAAHDGLLLINVGARYSQFFPMIEATAHTLGRASLQIGTTIARPSGAIDWDPARSEYVIVTRPEHVAAIRRWFPLEEDDGRVHREITTIEGNYIRASLVWSDDRHAAIAIVDPGRLLAPQ